MVAGLGRRLLDSGWMVDGWPFDRLRANGVMVAGLGRRLLDSGWMVDGWPFDRLRANG